MTMKASYKRVLVGVTALAFSIAFFSGCLFDSDSESDIETLNGQRVYEWEEVDRKPELLGSRDSLQAKIEYPEIARKAGIEGLVIVRFIVNKQGNLENLEVPRKIGGGCDEEALRVAQMARFRPGMHNGKFVNVRDSLVFEFRLGSASIKSK